MGSNLRGTRRVFIIRKKICTQLTVEDDSNSEEQGCMRRPFVPTRKQYKNFHSMKIG